MRHFTTNTLIITVLTTIYLLCCMEGNIDDYDQPFNNFINYQYSYLNPDASIQTDLFFNKLSLKSDDNFIGNSKSMILIIRCHN